MISDGRLYEVNCGVTKAIRSDGPVGAPCRGSRQGVEHDDFRRPFVRGQLRSYKGHQIGWTCWRPLQELHEGDDFLIAVDGAADHGRLHDIAMRIEHRLDLRRIDVEARTDDHFLGAADDMEAIAVEAREIAGIEPALRIDRLGREIGGAVVAAHHVAAAYVKLADLAVADRDTVDRPDAGLDARQQRSNRLIAAWCIEAHAGYSGRALGDAVAVGKRQPELALDTRLQVEVERRAGHRDQPQRSTLELLEARHGLVFQQALIGGGHAVEDGDSLFGDRLRQRRRLVAGDEAGRRANHQHHDQERDADDMRDRQHDVDLVVRIHPTEMRGGLRADQKIVMGQHHSLWRAGRARRVDQNRDLFPCILLGRFGDRACIQRRHADRRQRPD